MASKEGLIGQLLLKLSEEGGKSDKQRETEFRTRLLGRLQESGSAPIPYPVKPMKLADRFGRSPVNLFEENGPSSFIPLKPVVKGDPVLPYLSVVANKTLTTFRLLLLIFAEGPEDGSVKSVGLRFESPEGKDGRHNYWHVQLTSSFERNGGQAHPSTPSWLPSNTPAIPLDASNPETCVIALVVALYGGVEADTLVRNLGISQKEIDRLRNEVKVLSANRGYQE